MTIRSKQYIKDKFKNGDIPTEDDFSDLVESSLVGFSDEQTIGDSTAAISSTAATTLFLRSGGGQQVIGANPQIDPGIDCQELTLIGSDNTDYVTITNGNGIILKSDTCDLIEFQTLQLKYYESISSWVEVQRALVDIGGGTPISGAEDITFDSLLYDAKNVQTALEEIMNENISVSQKNTIIYNSALDFDVPGVAYKSIANALAYIALRVPSAVNIWNILLNGTSSESFTPPNYVNFVGLDSSYSKLTGTLNISSNNTSKFKNINFTGATITVGSSTNASFENCYTAINNARGTISIIDGSGAIVGMAGQTLNLIITGSNLSTITANGGTVNVTVYGSGNNCSMLMYDTINSLTAKNCKINVFHTDIVATTINNIISSEILSYDSKMRIPNGDFSNCLLSGGTDSAGEALIITGGYFNNCIYKSADGPPDELTITGGIHTFGEFYNVIEFSDPAAIFYFCKFNQNLSTLTGTSHACSFLDTFAGDYDNSISGLSATNIQEAIDELATGLPSGAMAIDIVYDGTASGLSADNVQFAIDELAAMGPGGGDAFTMPPNVVLVDPDQTEVVGYRYQTIAAAIIYVLTQTPAADNRWGIKFSGTNIEIFIPPDYVDIIGETGAVLDGNLSISTTFSGIYNCYITNLIESTGSINLYNCLVLINGSIEFVDGTYNIASSHLTGTGTLNIASYPGDDSRVHYTMEDDVNFGTSLIDPGQITDHNGLLDLPWIDASLGGIANAWATKVADGLGFAAQFSVTPATTEGMLYVSTDVSEGLPAAQSFSILTKIKLSALPSSADSNSFVWMLADLAGGPTAPQILLQLKYTANAELVSVFVDDATNDSTITYDISALTTGDYHWIAVVIDKTNDRHSLFIDGVEVGFNVGIPTGDVTITAGPAAFKGIVFQGGTNAWDLTISESYNFRRVISGDELVGTFTAPTNAALNTQSIIKDDAVTLTKSGVGAITNRGDFYDNSTSGLISTEVQSAIDELVVVSNTVLTASGDILAGYAVSVVSDGVVEVTKETVTILDSLTGFENVGKTVQIPGTNVIVKISYLDGYVTAGTVAADVITWGTPVEFCDAALDESQIDLITWDNVAPSGYGIAIAYADDDNSGFGTVVVATVAGDVITLGTPEVFNAEEVLRLAMTVKANGANSQIVISYITDPGATFKLACVTGALDLAGVTVVMSDEMVIVDHADVATTSLSMANIPDSYKVAIGYIYAGDVGITIAELLGTNLIFSDMVTFLASAPELKLCYVDAVNRLAVIYEGAFSHINCAIGKLVGNTISFTFPSEDIAWNGGAIDAVYNPTTECIYISLCYDIGERNRLVVMAVNEDSIFCTGVNIVYDLLSADDIDYSYMLYYTYGGDERVFVFTYYIATPNNMCHILNTTSNLSNWIGFSNDTVLDGEELTIATLGKVNANFTTLTTNTVYYLTALGMYTPPSFPIVVPPESYFLTSKTKYMIGKANSTTELFVTKDYLIDIDASIVSIDSGISGLAAENVKDAIDELAEKGGGYTFTQPRVTLSKKHCNSALLDNYGQAADMTLIIYPAFAGGKVCYQVSTVGQVSYLLPSPGELFYLDDVALGNNERIKLDGGALSDLITGVCRKMGVVTYTWFFYSHGADWSNGGVE